MKKIILSALLAGTTALAASSALALDPSKYSVGIALGWGIQDKTTYDTNLIGATTIAPQGKINTFATDNYITQKSFPTVDLRLGYNVNSFLQLGLNALYTHKLESTPQDFRVNTFATPLYSSFGMKTQENLFDVMVRAHFYSPESSMGTALFTGPSAGWESSKLKLATGTTAKTLPEAFVEANKRKNTAILGWDMGIAQTLNKAGTSVEVMGSIVADMKKEYKADDFKGDGGLPAGGTLTQKIRPAARISIAVKQSF